jgi:DMSO/TMAO reductase YedYZ molybdopterin-dependent catalytic subunit
VAQEQHELTRRQFLGAAAVLLGPAAASFRQTSTAQFISALPLGNPGNLPVAPFSRLLGASLDARLFTDLSILDGARPETLITPNDRYYVRTAYPAPARTRPSWTIPIGGPGDSSALTLAALRADATPAGPYVMECAGNADPANFGLLSAAAWDGVPLHDILATLRAPHLRPN